MSNVFNNMKISTKLSLTFGVLLLSFTGFSALSLSQMGQIKASEEDFASNWLPSVEAVSTLNNFIGDYRILESELLLANDKEKPELEKSLAAKKAEVNAAKAKYEKLISSDEEKATYQDFVTKWDAYLSASEETLAAEKAHDTANAVLLFNTKGKEANEVASDTLDKLVEINKKGGEASDARGDNIYANAYHVAWIMCAVVVLIIASALVALIRAISRPVRKMTDISAELANGNYKIAIEGLERGDEIGALANALTSIRKAVANYSGQINAINKAQAVIEFNLDGTIINANENFLSATGYTLDEIKGKHHGMFVDPAFKASVEYQQFWSGLGRGDYQIGEYKRIAKGGRMIWLQASYNPIFDLDGKPYKVVKYATDITETMLTRTENERGMYEAVEVLSNMAAGDLTQRMEGDYKGTFSDIKKAVNAMVDKLIETVTRIKGTAQSVNAAASEIAAGSSDLSMRTEQQASSLEETAASMEEITGTVKQNSQNASSANELSTSASQIANQGGRVVEEAVSAMANIEKSSQKISDIISVIDEIAFQTNLLALNAAVEAARAGDAGKGFAVVASEVRALAGRSASASKEIKTLINESASQVKTGAQLVNQAGETLKDIVGSVKQVAGIVSEIASASVEQSTGIDEINSAVTQMDEVTQQNAALVEENTAAAQSMLEQAKALESMISFFRVDSSEQAVIAAQPAKTVIKGMAKPAARKAAAGKAPVELVAKAHAANNGNAYDTGWEEF